MWAWRQTTERKKKTVLMGGMQWNKKYEEKKKKLQDKKYDSLSTVSGVWIPSGTVRLRKDRNYEYKIWNSALDVLCPKWELILHSEVIYAHTLMRDKLAKKWAEKHDLQSHMNLASADIHMISCFSDVHMRKMYAHTTVRVHHRNCTRSVCVRGWKLLVVVTHECAKPF